MSVERVLVVEDEAMLVQIIRRALVRRFAVEVDAVADGRAGLERAEARPYALILSDLQMPEMDGLSMVEHIRAGSGPNRGTPVVILTAHHEEGKAAAAQLDARFMAKPFSRRVLAETLGDLLPPAT